MHTDFYTFNESLWESVANSRPVLLHFFDGFMDAGNVSDTLTDYILKSTEPEVLAEFDLDLTHDYRARRPKMIFDTDEWRSVEEIRLTLYLARDLVGRPFLLLAGPEPDMRWHVLRNAIVDLIDRLAIPLTVTAHGVPMAVPHTREVPLTTHATSESFKRKNPGWVDRIEVPGSFSAYLELGLGQRGHQAMGLVAHVPHYLAQGTYLRAAEIALDRIMQVTGLRLPADRLRSDARDNIDVINAEAQANPEVEQVIEALETQYDSYSTSEAADLPTAEELGAEFERFLAEQDPKSSSD